MKACLKVLVIDDEDSVLSLVGGFLRDMGHEYEYASSGEAAQRLSKEALSTFDVAVVDWNMPGMNGFETAEYLRHLNPNLLYIMLTAHGTPAKITESFRLNFVGYLEKEIEFDAFKKAFDAPGIEQRLRFKQIVQKKSFVISEKYCMVGSSKQVQELKNKIQKVALSDATALILGDNGTGKEIVARALHKYSPRKDKPFYSISAAAIPSELLESELFGHEKGAFTGALAKHEGLLVEANKGTVFLDEIGEMPLPLQSKLLRALQEQEVKPTGKNTNVPIDVRFIAATNKNLKKLVAEGKFREDLYYRLNVLNLAVPSLGKRQEDIPELITFFSELFSSDGKVPVITDDIRDFLINYPWPGNIRQLQTVVQRAAIFNSWEYAIEDLEETDNSDAPDSSSAFDKKKSELDSVRVSKCKLKLKIWDEAAEEVDGDKFDLKTLGDLTKRSGQGIGQYIKDYRREFLSLLLGESEKWPNIRKLDNIRELLDVAADVKFVLKTSY